jgi:bifunctional DNase/RNase
LSPRLRGCPIVSELSGGGEKMRAIRKRRLSSAGGRSISFDRIRHGFSEFPRAGRACLFGGASLCWVDMKSDVLPIEIRGILPMNNGCGIFVGNNQKVFVIQVENNMGQVIGMFLKEMPKERPLTHDLMSSILKGFTITIERVVITELKNATYFARLFLQQDNELGRKIVEIDARPSDCLALATAQKRPIYVATSLFEQVEDMTEVLERINENTGESEDTE